MTDFFAGLEKKKNVVQQNNNDFFAGMDKNLTPYERYMRQKTQNTGDSEGGYLDAAQRAVKSTLGSMGSGVSYLVGAEDTAKNLNKYAQDNARRKEFDSIFNLDYWTDPEGATYDVVSGGASMLALAPAAAALPASVGTGAAALAGRYLGGRLGAWAASEAGKKAIQLGARGAATAIPESLSEWGGTAQQAAEEGMENPRMGTISDFAANMAVLPASNALEYMLLGGKLFTPTAKAGEKALTRIAKAPFRAAPATMANAAQNSGEELLQTTASENALGHEVGNPLNPYSWTDDQKQAWQSGLVVGGVLSGASNTARGVLPANRNTQQQPEKATGANLVDRVRALEGHITYEAPDGTNCMRTMGLALAGTPYEGQINVDQAVATAQQNNQLMDPENYTPRAGDLAVVEDGNHIVMVTENGGTIQNGQSHNGVYESEQSANDMFGKVKYYIRTSDYNNSRAGVGRADLRSEYADEVSADNATDRAIEQMNASTPNIKLPEREEINFGQTAQSEADDNAALSDYSEADARRTAGRTEADDYMGLTGEEQENGQAWDNYRAPQRTGGFKFTGGRASNYNPTEAMQTPFLNRIRQQEAQHRRDLEWYAMEEEKARRDIEAGKVQPNSQLVEKALKDNRLAGIIESAAQGNANAQRAFSVIRPDVRRALLQQIRERKADKNIFRQERKAPFTSGYFNNPQAFVGMNRLSQIERNIAESKIKMQEAKDAAERAAARTEMLQSAEEYFRSGDFTSPLEGVRSEIKGTQQGIKELLKPIVDTILAGGGERARLIETEDDYRKIRVGQNMPYYSELYKKYGRKPTMKELYDEARDIYTGDSSIAIPGWQRNAENEADFAHNKAVLKELDDNLDMYEELEKKFAAEPDGGRRNGQAEKGNDDENTARRQAEKKEADNQNSESENEVNKKAAELADGYRTESGRPLNEADEKEFIIKPDGSRDFGRITEEVERATNGELTAAPIRLQVGNAEFGYKHLLNHLKQMQSKGFESAFDFVDHVLNNFNQVYSQQTNKKPNRFVLYCKGDDSKGFMPIDLEFENSGDYYTIVSAMPHKEKIKGTLIYDGSTRPSTATTNGSLSADTNNEGGDGAAIVLAKSNVPFGTSIVAQTPDNSKNETSSEPNIPNNQENSQNGAPQSEQEQTPAPAERSADAETEPSEKAKGRIGEKFDVFDSSADNYAREVEISKIKKVRDNYYYGDSRNATLYKIDDLKTGRSDELAAEIENERRRIEEARAEKQERETKAEKNVDRSLSEFTKDLKPVQRGNLMKVLGKELNYGPDEGVKTRAEHMRDVLKNGNFVTSKQDGSKTEYRVYDGKEASGTFEIITKAEYDYYNWLKEQAEKKAEAKKQATKPTASKVAPKAKIEDFGEKIGGARKDVYGEWKELMQNAEKIDVKAVPLSKSWPEPDYDKLIENGANKSQVAFIRALRDAIPAKPRQSYGLGNWTKMVESFRRAANNILNGSDGYEWKSAEQYLKDKRAELNTVVFDIIGRAKLYEEVGHKYSLRGISFNQHAYSVFNGKRYDKPKAFWVVEQKTKATAFNNFPRMLAYGETEAAALEQFKKNYEMLLNKDTKKKHVTFNFYFNGKGDDREYIIGKKIGRNAVKLKGGFKTLKEAYEYRDSHYDELVSQLEKMKEVPMERGDINRPRVGQDMRGGLDVTPEMFTEAFGFRGVEFCNYV